MKFFHKQIEKTKRVALFVCLIVFSALLISSESTHGQSPQTGSTTDNFCAVCHSDTHVEFQESAHLREGVACADCHGGDPVSQTIAGAHSKNFRALSDRKQIVEVCSTCHSDPQKMKPYGIPIDQHALYLTSVHGKKFMQGDMRVAVCSDCHGAHRVLATADPRSPVYRENIPQTCGRCHENAELMKAYNRSSGVVSDYCQSAHGQGLLERHNRQSPDCTRCHGTHGAAPPGTGNVAKVCGQCHTKTLEAFRHSPHAEAMATGHQGECASCHSNHRIERAGHQMWASACSSCHEQNAAATDRGNKIQALFMQAEAEQQKARSLIEEARRIPLAVGDYEARLSDSLTYLFEARPLSHNLSLEDMEDLTRRARSIALEVQSDIHEKMSVFRGRFIVLSVVWFYILISIAAAVRFRRTLEKKRAKPAGEDL